VKHFADVVKKAKPVYGNDAVMKAFNVAGDVRIEYRDQSDFENIARQFGIFEEWKVIVRHLSISAISLWPNEMLPIRSSVGKYQACY